MFGTGLLVSVLTVCVDMRNINLKVQIKLGKRWYCVSCWLLPKTILVRLVRCADV